MRFAIASVAILLAATVAASAQEEEHAADPAALAAESLAENPESTAALPPEHHHFHFQGVMGTYDQGALQRGFQVYREVCAACHGLEYVAFRTLGQAGGPFYDEEYPNPNDNPVIKALAAEYQITAGPDDFGEMFQRPGLPSDYLPSPFANPQAAAAANGGAVPPDLSLITKARHHGPDYVASLMLGYVAPPAGVEVQPGLYFNPYFEGWRIAMPQQIRDGSVTYADGTEATAEQISRDVAEFLAWASEPKAQARKSMGLAVLAFLVILAGLTYASYRAIWHNIEH